MPDDQPWTIGRLLTWTTDYLQERGAESPRLDAEVLLAHARQCRRIELYTAFEEPADEELRSRFRELVRLRAGGQPVAYLVGSREFFSLAFEVSSEVLIPRPETEQLVVLGLDWLKQRRRDDPGAEPQAPTIADVGVGSGVLAVCLAKHCPTAQVAAIDVCEPALAIARRNAERHGVANRIEFLHGDLFDSVPPEVRFDLIVSNPPYVTSGELARLDDEVRRFEPHVALDGGPDGVAVIGRLVSQAHDRLQPGGLLLIEVSPTINRSAERLIEAAPGLRLLPTEKDLAGLPRVVQAEREESP